MTDNTHRCVTLLLFIVYRNLQLLLTITVLSITQCMTDKRTRQIIVKIKWYSIRSLAHERGNFLANLYSFNSLIVQIRHNKKNAFHIQFIEIYSSGSSFSSFLCSKCKSKNYEMNFYLFIYYYNFCCYTEIKKIK